MPDASALIETLETRFMRAWIGGDTRELKALTARSFILLVGSKPARILDQRSWLEAAGKHWQCRSFRFGDVYVRRLGAIALFGTQVELSSTLDGIDWSGPMWVTDVWRKRRIGGWRLVHRSISRVEEDSKIPGAVKALQLWR
jgi:ketosteroid isomerase-like protein